MNYSIENDLVYVAVSDVGAELQSICLKANQTQYLWQGDPAYWARRAMHIFPVVGRLTDGKYRYAGKEYDMMLHGFMREICMDVMEQATDTISFHLRANEETLLQYPFDFELVISYQLSGTSLKVNYHVVNRDTKTMIYACGNHAGYNVPLQPGEAFEDYYLEFDRPTDVKHIVFSDTCYLTHQETAWPMVDGCKIPLRHNLFDNDAIILGNTCREVTLKSAKSARHLHISFQDMPYVAIWHKPHSDAPYVCIQPWYSLPAYDGVVDQLETKRDMVHLAPGASRDLSYSVNIG
ncbi:MAG: aldose 1-epimerase family protein [Lawsonibacter sp.]